MPQKVKVDIIESEKGWGSRVDETLNFDNYEEAEKYCREYNNKYNPSGPAPDWYMYARIQG